MTSLESFLGGVFGRAIPLTLAIAIGAPALAAQSSGPTAAKADTVVYELDAITVTATRSPRPISETPMPVSVIAPRLIDQRTPNSISELFTFLPGLDITGTGANQGRPVIRGQRGQRILLMQNGIRMNNSRRQQDFGELPALIDVSDVARVEVVRGPGSVLYGTDAIGGVINVITDATPREGVHGKLNYRYGNAQDQNKGTVSIYGGGNGWDFDVLASVREAGPYSAPAGTFGDLTLNDQALVDLTGVEDRNLSASLGYRFNDDVRVRANFERYDADEAGFGYVDPAAYDPGAAEIRIQYPFQDVQRFSLNFQAEELDAGILDRLDFTTYFSDNERQLDFNLFQGFGPQAPPGAGVLVETSNFTDVQTFGFRAEAKKAATDAILFTYGVDYFRDETENTDFIRSTISGFGPPMVTESDAPNVPNALYSSLGGFLQAELDVIEGTRIVAGGRVQRVQGESQPTPNFSEDLAELDNTAVVGSLNVLQRLGGGFTAVGTLGRAFRAPNLVEMFFEGPTPEGSGYQARNDELVPETSLNVDLGLRYTAANVSAEAFYFRNKIFDGIRVETTSDTIQGFPVSRNVNVDELLFQGVELALSTQLPRGFGLGGTYTYVDTRDVLNPDNPVGDSYSSKTTGWVRYDHPMDYFWLQFEGRRNGERKDVLLAESPIGEVMPAFTVLNARAGFDLPITGPFRSRLSVALENITDELYAEFSNASFFRPEPGRNLTLSIETIF